MTDNDGVKVVAVSCRVCKDIYPPIYKDNDIPHFHIGGPDIQNDPLISALDEADAVDRLCPCRRMEQTSCDPMDGCACDKNCRSYVHAHADKLRGLK